MRSVRSEKFKYIRNFMSYRPHTQRNQYKDTKEISMHMRELYHNRKLNALQSRFYKSTRPVEELYDLENDPFEIYNLANNTAYKAQLKKMRSLIYNKMAEISDPGLIPEPILEDLGRQYGNKYSAMRQPAYVDIQKQLIQIVEAGEAGNIEYLTEKVNSKYPSERYWAITWLGVNKAEQAKEIVSSLSKDDNPSVRIAACLAHYKIDKNYNPIPALSQELNNNNLLVGMYAMNAIEQTGIRNAEVRLVAEEATKSKYEFTKRIGKYLVQVCDDNN
jgi:hypothetical protein